MSQVPSHLGLVGPRYGGSHLYLRRRRRWDGGDGDPGGLGADPSLGLSYENPMLYYVIAADGNKYGPADVPTLNQWAREGRLGPQTMLETADGMQIVASRLPGLIFPSAPTDYASPPQPQPFNTGPSTPSVSPYAGYYTRDMGYGGAFDPTQFPKFNWGAFLLNWIWALNHRKPIGLIALIPCVGFFFSLYMGFVGYQWAWESGRFNTVSECRKCQSIWGWWGLGVLLLGLCFNVFGALIGEVGRF